ncbi:MAG: SAM-dependent methyltransferase, partial [Pseudomonadota bacterium]|nr:SAM-dependent methyltransferase [Pseudomonadota bacterium]
MELPSGQKFLIEGKTSKNINATLMIKSYKLLPLLLFKGGLGAGESYIKGYWTASDLTQILKMAALNRESLSNQLMGYGAAKFFDRLLHFFRQNSLGRAKKNISYHYDLGNNFYSQWL